MEAFQPPTSNNLGGSPTLPDPPAPPPPPIGAQVVAPQRNYLRWLIIGVAFAVLVAFIGIKVSAHLSAGQKLTMEDISTSTVEIGTKVRVANPIDLGLKALTVVKVVRGSTATAQSGDPKHSTHEQVTVSLTVCADQRFTPNGTAAIWLETMSGKQIFPDPSVAADSLLNSSFSEPGCQSAILAYTVTSAQKLRQVTYAQFPYLRANWRISARAAGPTS